ncbi:MAG: GH25 family lysozyme [Eubacterium sp.]
MFQIKKRSFLFLLVICAITGMLFIYNLGSANTITHNAKNYPVKGVDVSTYQGLIDWPLLAQNDLSFVFIKATEGSSFIDDDFAYNFHEAAKTHLMIGAYHFFSYESSGATQANNYINTVPIKETMLPPVVDLEFYGNYNRFNIADKDKTRQELTVLLDTLEQHYGQKPIIYTSPKVYSIYLANHYEDYPLWISNYHSDPVLPDQKQWTFWQYTDRGFLSGYSGYAPNIDLNVYRGSLEEFNREFRSH